ncbi:MAG: hypothetical protein DRP15_02365 [Candidatus Aenigmatarchaeota archaeon]|nr:MAG: hypothetical protein DRP15_02365 [Candidatus Aenigmarchaeota archaeon]
MSVFRAYDIRGVYPEEINEDLMRKIGSAVGRFIFENNFGDHVVLGRDFRYSSKSLSEAVKEGVISTGIDVVDCGVCSLGLALYTGWAGEKDFGEKGLTLYVTASHLPPEHNGLKLYTWEGIGLSEENIMRIHDIVKSGYFGETTITGAKKRADFLHSYTEFMKNHFHVKPLRVAVDCGGGATITTAPIVFRSLGMNVVEIFCKPDPEFKSRPSDPLPENIDKLRETVIEEKADFGVAFDGDGDRATIVDDKGNVLTPNKTGIILGQEILKEKPGKVIVNVECSLLVEKFLGPLSTGVKRIPVGHSYLTQECKDPDVRIGIEASGHFILPSYFYFDDALLVPLKMAEIISKGKKLSELSEGIKEYLNQRFEFKCDDDIKFAVIKRLKDRFLKEFKDRKIDTIDGIRIDFDDSWVLIRVSNTSPKMRLTIEAKNRTDFEKLRRFFSSAIESEIKNVQKIAGF